MKNNTGRLIAAAPETTPDILYAGGFNAPDEVIYAETGHKKMLFVSSLELERARAQARKNVEVIPYESIFQTDDPRKSTVLLKRISEKLNVTEWSVPEQFPLLYADSLRENGIKIAASAEVFFPNRACKTADEVKKIAAAMNATQDAMMMVRDFLKGSTINSRNILMHSGKLVTSELLRSMIEGFLKSLGYTANQTITAAGEQASQPHNVGSGPIHAGDPIVVDIFPRSDATGYWGDMTRTFVKGHPLPVVEKAFKSVLKASQLAESMIRAGVNATEVHQAAADSMKADGFNTGINKQGQPCGFFHGLGHGVGLWIHEAPRVSPSNPKPLQKGNVISNEPGLYNPAWGGIRLEDCLLVTETGCRNFYTMEKELFV